MITSSVLVIHQPGQPSQEVQLSKDFYTIGRGRDNDVIVDMPEVSRRHGQLTREGADWAYTNLSTTNGTRMNGQLVGRILLREGMRLQLGKNLDRSAEILFHLSVPVERPEAVRTTKILQGCPRCHVPLRPGATFCPNCGFHLVPSPTVPPKTGNVSKAPEFEIYEVGEAPHSHVLSKPVMRVGRSSDNDIVIQSHLVSHHHLQAEIQSGKVTITDLHSTNGTMVNGRRIPPGQAVMLHLGDVIRVGDLTGNSLRITFGGALAQGLRTLSVGILDLSKLATQPSVTIGRASDCDLSITHPGVSKHHAQVVRADGKIMIRDLGSTNGTFVNGNCINQAILSDGDEVQVGPIRFVYDGRQNNLAGARRLGHRLDAFCLVRQVKGGAVILNNVSVSIHSSEFVALVGGSGAGKSTLLKALNGYEPATRGKLLIDGEDLYSRLDMYRTEMGYVPQDDIIHRELPVRLALWYAAKLRLPDASEHEIQKTIDEALTSVEMTEHQNKRVKDLSGGQRKRVSIASELLAQPTLFFLDEPTSGLDPGLEKKMMFDLKRLADQGRTIVLVTHATTNIEQCDYVAFMANGEMAYYGPPGEAPTFFDARDFPDIYQKLSYEINPDKGFPPQPEIKDAYQEYISTTPPIGATPFRKVQAGVLWAERFRKSPIYQKYIAARQANLHATGQPDLARNSRSVKPAPVLFLQQTYYLARRHIDLIRHDIRTMIILLAMLPFIGFLFGISSESWWLTGDGWQNRAKTVITSNIKAAMIADLKGQPKDASNTYTPYQDASTLVMMIALAFTQAGTFAASYEIVKERPIFQRERAVNLSVWAYVLAKVVVLSLFAILQVAATLLLVGLWVDLSVRGIIFIDLSIVEIFITLYLAVLASIGLGLFISAMVPSSDVVLYVILAQLFLQIVLSGTLFPMPNNPLSYVSPGYWATDALSSIVDLPRLDKEGVTCRVAEVEKPTETGSVKELQTFCDSAESNAESLKGYAHTMDHLVIPWIAMGFHLVFWVALTIIVQSRKKAGKE